MPDTNTFKTQDMQIVLDTRGLQMSVRNGCFIFETEADSRIIHPGRVSSILIVSACRISSPALILAATSQIPVIFCDPCGRPMARIWSPMFKNTSGLRRGQHRFAASERAMIWATEIIRLKIKGQTDNLRFIANRKPSLVNEVNKSHLAIGQVVEHFLQKRKGDNASDKKQLLFMEAFAASQYWQILGKAIPEPYRFTNRVKRFPNDGFNASINYLYGMLRNQVETSVLSIGLDPALGIMHRDGFKMPSLVFDLMEPFRPIMDRILLMAIIQGTMVKDALEQKDDKLLITKTGRKQLIEMFTKKLHSRMLYREASTTLVNHILTEARQLANTIKKEAI